MSTRQSAGVRKVRSERKYYKKIARKYWEKTKIRLNEKENQELSMLVRGIEATDQGREELEKVFEEAEKSKSGRGRTLKEVWKMDQMNEGNFQLTMTSNTLVLMADIDGFQHGQEPFTPKCLALACDRIEGSYSWLFDTSHLLGRPSTHLTMYRYQMEEIHGLTLMSPGIPVALFPSVLAHTIFDILLECLAMGVRAERPQSIILFLKGRNKILVLQEALAACELPVTVSIRNLEDIGCPTAARLCPDIRSKLLSTQFKTNEYAIWFAQ
ncbi:hypothetical protein OS493_013527 [Desmophyllum pertusum]|uniref:Uncharacterized protein n=1 Tax=Desmophyllum pertusum TaxID=174260 RepID=A0A9X0A322_9CNID|nr:hypothetical protein OS493_013527 [Desmophyllum pertusum]